MSIGEYAVAFILGGVLVGIVLWERLRGRLR